MDPTRLWAAVRRARLIRVLIVYVGASFVALQAVALFQDKLGLPDWLFPVAVALLLIGLPIIVATALVQSAHHAHAEGGDRTSGTAPAPSAPGPVPGPALGAPAAGFEVGTRGPGSRHWLTWKRALLGGVFAFAAFGLFVAGYMLMRNLGVGPAGTLVAKGVLDERDPVLVADFENRTADSLLGPAVTEAFRVDLAQSPVITVVDPSRVRRTLERMRLPAGALMDARVAQEVALREGIKAFIDGDVNAAGTAYVLSARIVSADSGHVLAAFRENASDSTQILSALDRLSAQVREKIGESLRTIRGGAPLAQVTTSSLEALRRYSQAQQAYFVDGDTDRGIALMQEATQLDTAFAMAWRALGVMLGNNGLDLAGARAAFTRAYEHRDRLTDRERYQTEASYFAYAKDEPQKAITAYRTLLGLYPSSPGAVNNLGLLYDRTGRYAEAESLFVRALSLDSLSAPSYTNLLDMEIARGDFHAADSTVAEFQRRLPGHPWARQYASWVASAGGRYDSAEARLWSIRESGAGGALFQGRAADGLATLARLRGKLSEAEKLRRQAAEIFGEGGLRSQQLGALLGIAWIELGTAHDTSTALRRAAEALTAVPLDSLAPGNRPYRELASFYAVTGEPGRARRYLAAADSAWGPGDPYDPTEPLTRGILAMAEGRVEKAVELFRRADQVSSRGFSCGACALPELGRAYEAAGQPDSAIAAYERYRSSNWTWKAEWDALLLPDVLERLGALYAKKGEAAKAREAYGRLLELWKDAEPALQARIARIRAAMEALPTGGGAASAAKPAAESPSTG